MDVPRFGCGTRDPASPPNTYRGLPSGSTGLIRAAQGQAEALAWVLRLSSTSPLGTSLSFVFKVDLAREASSLLSSQAHVFVRPRPAQYRLGWPLPRSPQASSHPEYVAPVRPRCSRL